MYKGLINNQHTNNYMYKAQTRNIAIVEVLFSIGMRVSEVCNLNYEDINLRNGVIRVFGKGSKERIIQICQSETLSIIRTYYQSYKQEIGYSLPIFINRLGQRVSTQSVRLMIKSYVKKAGLSKRITPHLARHIIFSFPLKKSKLQDVFS